MGSWRQSGRRHRISKLTDEMGSARRTPLLNREGAGIAVSADVLVSQWHFVWPMDYMEHRGSL